MGNKHTVNTNKIIKSSSREIQELISSKFSENELKTLYILFHDLALHEKSTNLISPQSFYKFCNVPGIIGMRLYSLFNKDNKKGITFESFIRTMATLAKSNDDDLYQALFTLYDIDNDGYFGIEDLVTIIRTIEKSGIIPELMKMKQKTFDKKKEQSGSSTEGSSKSIPTEESLDDSVEYEAVYSVYISSERVHKLAKRIFKKSGFYSETLLNFEQFVTLIKKNSYLENAIVCAVRKDLWSEGS